MISAPVTTFRLHIPPSKENYSTGGMARQRCESLQDNTDVNLSHVSQYSFHPAHEKMGRDCPAPAAEDRHVERSKW
jgi:hypothetical protein